MRKVRFQLFLLFRSFTFRTIETQVIQIIQRAFLTFFLTKLKLNFISVVTEIYTHAIDFRPSNICVFYFLFNSRLETITVQFNNTAIPIRD
jgi:hypothetical protein